MAQPDARSGPYACAVRPPVRDGVCHQSDPRRIDGLCRFEMEDARYATHMRLP